MGNASKYWLLISIHGLAKCCFQELQENRIFFQQKFSGLINQEDVPDRDIQCQLMQWYQNHTSIRQLAEGCLRCFVSNQIKEMCEGLEAKFGKNHGFTSADILPLVLDSNRMRNQTGQSLTTRILQTFDPEKSNLSTWTSRMLKSDRTVKQFLLEHGIEQVTDWMILCYMTSGRLARILSEYQQTSTEINQGLQLLDSYHQVYRTQILQNRQPGAKSRYPEPTLEQLHQIAKLLPNSTISPEEVREELQKLARLLREERIAGKIAHLSVQ